MSHWPQRIVCLTTETVEVLYLLGEQDRIVGISGFTTRPAIARKEKPKISGFISANINKILALDPDLVLCFSNLQADIAASLIKAGCQVHVFNQRSLDETLQMILTVGDLVGASDKAQMLVTQYQALLDASRNRAATWSRKPTIYFEEWDEPMMCSIRWAAELITAAGGQDCFPELSGFHNARDRQVNAEQVVAAQPDIIIGSWCGKKFQPEKVKARTGWQTIPAVQHGHLYEIKSVDILQPGPALFTEGLVQLQNIIEHWQQQTGRLL
ncbi:cobalamin-binding protein [Methylophilus sp. Leaf414]|uniref:cobalamin-binding protein n=1 Tax=Methylophilus sp. Leaf414 TaxID=1736371 RepID=UPI0006FB4D88|nr:cobalamin-binding protein [Methylophilus sp. Leaf414]KQT36767.1 ABC transporter substrate-binding protein [Methylophilus sp. Leaf414]